MTKILDYILDKIFKEFETLKQNKKKMMINFIILYLIIFVLIGVSINEYYSIRKYQEILEEMQNSGFNIVTCGHCVQLLYHNLKFQKRGY